MNNRLSAASTSSRYPVSSFFAVLFGILISSLVVVGLSGGTQRASAAQRSVTWTNFDVTIDLQQNGSYHVQERQEIQFNGGPYTGGFADIPLRNIEGIKNVDVSEVTPAGAVPYTQTSSDDYAGNAGTYSVESSSSEIYIQWGFDSATDETRTFLLDYDVEGALRVYPDADPPNEQIWWTAISSDVTDIAPVQHATTTIRLPQPVDPDQVIAGSEEVDLPVTNSNGQDWTWTYDNMQAGDQFIVRLQFPPIINVAPPPWQQQADERQAALEAREQRTNLANLILLAASVLLAIVGAIGIYGLWYSVGRDPHSEELATFLAKPPDDLAPGAAGVLIDEVADQKDIVATLLDLARRHAINIEEVKKGGLFGGQDHTLTLLNVPDHLKPFERDVLTALFGSQLTVGETTSLTAAKPRFDSSADTIRAHLYDEVVERGYFSESPDRVRSKWAGIGTAFLVAGVLLILLVVRIVGDFSWGFWPFAIVLGTLALAIILLSRHMPRKSESGAEAARKWQAFKRYLEDIRKYETVGDHTDLFEKYLPYAIAFGIDAKWVHTFAQAGAPAPSWYGPTGGGWSTGQYPTGRVGRPYGPGPVIVMGDLGRSGSGPSVDAPNVPDLQSMSDSMGRSLSSSSDGLFSLLRSASSTFSGVSASSGSSSGGGFGRSFGGGGFSGGGSFGGSSGGGGRGFS